MEVMVHRRNMLIQVLLMIVTFGLYSIYWFYQTTQEMLGLQKREENVFLWTIFLIFPFLFFYAYYKHGELYEQLSRGEVNRWVMFVLWVVFPPAVWFIVQSKLNLIADQTEQQRRIPQQ